MAESKQKVGTTSVPQHDEADQPKESSLKEADKRSDGYIGDAELQDEPVRSASPQEPMIGTLTVGAGAHEPPKDPHIGQDGRWYADTADADASFPNGERPA